MLKKERKKRGAPVKLSEKIQTKLYTALRAGNYIQVACQFAGIAVSTFYDWLHKGEKGKDGFVEFSKAMHEAMSHGEINLVVSLNKYAMGSKAQFDDQGRLVQNSIDPDWRAAAWMLERKFPERWGKRDQVKLFEAEKGEQFKPEGTYESMLEIIQRVEAKAKKDKEDAD